MINYLAFGTSLAVAGVAAWFSVIGLATIFSGAWIPVIIMAGTLEVGKLVTAAYLHQNWNITQWWMKTYLTLSVIVLMFITSMGIFGYLSKAHLEQEANRVVDYTFEIEVLEDKIEFEQFKIDNYKSQLIGLDDVLKTGRDRDKNYIFKTQKETREQIDVDINESIDNMRDLQNELLPLKKNQAMAELEVGPLKYIAELIYGEDEAKNYFDQAVRMVIILLVAVFDPLAVLLLIASLGSIIIPKDRKRFAPVNEAGMPDENFYDDNTTDVPPKKEWSQELWNAIRVDKKNIKDMEKGE